MIHKLALFAASLAAVLTLGVALAIAGFAPSAGPASAPTVAGAVQAVDDTTPPPVQVDKVYVATPPQQTVTVHKIVGSGGESEAEVGD